jgi:ubiquinone biosynthesis monooxygenase Coq7
VRVVRRAAMYAARKGGGARAGGSRWKWGDTSQCTARGSALRGTAGGGQERVRSSSFGAAQVKNRYERAQASSESSRAPHIPHATQLHCSVPPTLSYPPILRFGSALAPPLRWTACSMQALAGARGAAATCRPLFLAASSTRASLRAFEHGVAAARVFPSLPGAARAALSTAAGASGGAAAPSPDARAQDEDSHVRGGDAAKKALIDEMLRVDQAGETGAVYIYAGQMWALRGAAPGTQATLQVRPARVRQCRGRRGVRENAGRAHPPVRPPRLAPHAHAQHMKEGEVAHLEAINRLIAERRVRPTALLPLWQAAGFAVGAATALLGKEAAMACTVAVETSISAHYNDQIRELVARGYAASSPREGALAALLAKHRDEEMAHHDTALKEGAERAPFYSALSAVIQAGCAVAIAVAKRV